MTYRYLRHVALARQEGKLLMVEEQNARKQRSETGWWLPGGKVEQGEALVAGLQRELAEETGLGLVETPTLAFVVQIVRETVEGAEEGLVFFFDCQLSGQFHTNDPDGSILSVNWIDEEEALQRLEQLPWFDDEPLRRWLHGEAPTGTVYTKS